MLNSGSASSSDIIGATHAARSARARRQAPTAPRNVDLFLQLRLLFFQLRGLFLQLPGFVFAAFGFVFAAAAGARICALRVVGRLDCVRRRAAPLPSVLVRAIVTRCHTPEGVPRKA
jgi:hypothetical protein